MDMKYVFQMPLTDVKFTIKNVSLILYDKSPCEPPESPRFSLKKCRTYKNIPQTLNSMSQKFIFFFYMFLKVLVNCTSEQDVKCPQQTSPLITNIPLHGELRHTEFVFFI